MEIYLVGGAIRDQLLGIPVHERDWVVVGATPQQMLDLGYKQVGQDFPVFLHPKTHEEYALARTERKTGSGYTGFTVYAAPDITLEQDLQRRDLTINAMAQDNQGHLIDPYGGQTDLKNKILRHVSSAFIEDPVRILRIARFMTRFASLGFSIAEQTLQLMTMMVAQGEVDTLVAERVWQEWRRALQGEQPQQFFKVLKQCQALAVLFPELDHYEFTDLNQCIATSDNSEIRFALLLHDLTAKEVKQLCRRYRVPNNFQQLASLVVKYYSHYTQVLDSSKPQLLTLLHHTDAMRRPQRFKQWLHVCTQIALLNTIKNTDNINNYLESAIKQLKSLDIKQIVAKGYKGEQLKEAIQQAQLACLPDLNEL